VSDPLLIAYGLIGNRDLTDEVLDEVVATYSVEKLRAKLPGAGRSSGFQRLIRQASGRGCAREPL